MNYLFLSFVMIGRPFSSFLKFLGVAKILGKERYRLPLGPAHVLSFEYLCGLATVIFLIGSIFSFNLFSFIVALGISVGLLVLSLIFVVGLTILGCEVALKI